MNNKASLLHNASRRDWRNWQWQFRNRITKLEDIASFYGRKATAWENLKKALKAEYDDSVWEHLSGTTSAPFPAGEHGQVAVKVIDPRGNELIAIRKLEIAR